MTPVRRILAFATLGQGSSDEARILTLLRELSPEPFPFERARKLRSAWALFQRIRRTRPDLAVMEGTGLGGGLALLAACALFGTRYVVSSGDAVGPWIGTKSRLLRPAFALYERLLCRYAAGFIGWTPYLVGRALTFGTPRAVTAPGWAPFPSPADRDTARRDTRAKLGIGSNDLAIGIAGSLVWSRRYGYCYGAELVGAAARVERRDVRFLIVGDGDGRPHLERRAAALSAGRVVFAGRVPQAELPRYYAAMDVGSLPQSLDAVGSFRYTTKLSEYLTAGLGVAVGPIPMAYDLDDGWVWRVGGGHPWQAAYHAALARLLDGLAPGDVAAKSVAARAAAGRFDAESQVARVSAFVNELLAERPCR